jgi:hypothetical protein
MDRRESIKLMVLAAAGSGHLLEGRDLSAQERAFASKWHEWPDMRWAGPEHWGNRLQDWGVRDGMLECRTRAPDRTLHCLTHRIAGEGFVSRVTLLASQSGSGARAARAQSASRPRNPRVRVARNWAWLVGRSRFFLGTGPGWVPSGGGRLRDATPPRRGCPSGGRYRGRRAASSGRRVSVHDCAGGRSSRLRGGRSCALRG